jgi:predicted porin
MKRKLLPLLVAAVSATVGGQALAGAPTVYGKVNVTLQKYDLERIGGGAAIDEQDNWEMESNASRIGVKGDFEINENLSAIYKLEYEVAVDDGDADGDEFSQRNIYGGLQGPWGTLLAGKHDTPLKLAQGDVDRFNDLAIADIKNIMVGENRQSNIVMYSTPSFSGFGATLAVMQGEDSGVDGDDDNDGIADAVSAAVSYTNDTLYLALAHDKDVDTYDATRLVADVKLGNFKVGGIYQKAEHGSDANALKDISDPIKDFGGNFEEQDAYLLSAEWKISGPWKLKAQYGYSESTPVAAGLDDAEATLWALGLDYKLNDNSKIFAYYAMLESEGDTLISGDSTEDSTIAIGYEIKF